MQTIRRRAFLVLALAACKAGIGAQASDQPRQDVPRPTFSATVNRIVLYVTVRENNGGFVADLGKQDFTILEDGKPQDILTFLREDVPVAIGLLVDNSQSMMNKRTEMVEAAKTFVRATKPDDEIFILHFNERLSYGLPQDVPFTADRSLLEPALERMKLDGRTALYAAIAEGLRHLERSTLTKKALIVLSDGGDNMGPLRDDDVVKLADLSGASFYAIGIYDPLDGDANPGVLRNLATRTGGEAYFPERLDEVRTLCERIASTLRNQYALSYAPPPWTSDRVYHTLELKVRDPKRRRLTVRTRTGYYTSTPPR